MIKNIQKMDIVSSTFDSATYDVKFDYDRLVLWVTVTLFSNGDFQLHENELQCAENDNYYDYDFTHKEFDYISQAIEKFFYNINDYGGD